MCIRDRCRPHRCARQQCRHHARRHAASHEQGELGRGDPHQSRQRVQHDPPRHRRHARAQLRAHHLDLVDQRAQGPDGPGELFGGEGGAPRLHQGRRAGRGRQGHHRQRDRAGLHRDRNGDGRAERRAGDEDPAADPRGPARTG